MRKHRGCETLVDAMCEVEHAVLAFLGEGPLKGPLQDRAARHGLSGRVRFIDPVPPDELLAHTATADIGVTLLQDTCLNHRYALPNKLFEYLTAGVPVIATDLPEIRRVIETYDVGLLVEPGSHTALVAALRRAVRERPLREGWRRNIPHALAIFNWETTSISFLHAYRELLLDAP